MIEEVKMYALGKQAVNKYKKYLNPNNDKSWVNIDWKVPPRMLRRIRTKIFKKFRQPIKNYRMVARLINNKK